MHRFFIACVAVAVLAACDNAVPPLTVTQKANFYAEEIEPGTDCDKFRQQLAHPEAEAPEAVFQRALAARCVKKHV